jgi:sporulation protein YqfC
MELPEDTALDLPRITLSGDSKVILENHKGIVEYNDKRARIKTTLGVIRIEGAGLELKNINSEDIFIMGSITLVGYEGGRGVQAKLAQPGKKHGV